MNLSKEESIDIKHTIEIIKKLHKKGFITHENLKHYNTKKLKKISEQPIITIENSIEIQYYIDNTIELIEYIYMNNVITNDELTYFNIKKIKNLSNKLFDKANSEINKPNKNIDPDKDWNQTTTELKLKHQQDKINQTTNPSKNLNKINRKKLPK